MLDIRTFEFATFFADVTNGAYQLYSLRWIGGNEDPDIFEYVFHSAKFPPHGANRSYYANPKIDALIDQARPKLIPPAVSLFTTKFKSSSPRSFPPSTCGFWIMCLCTPGVCKMCN